MKKLLLIFFLAALVLLTFCEEDWPPYKIHIAKISASFKCTTAANILTRPNFAKIGLRFSIRNSSDEVITGSHHFTGKIYCWLTAKPDRVAEYDFDVFNEKIEAVIFPNEPYNVDVIYDLSFIDGTHLWDNISTPDTHSFKAYAEIQVMDKFNTLLTNTTEFDLFFMF